MNQIQRLSSSLGSVLGTSDWVAIPQTRIDAFADLTEDWQFIHVDPVRAAASPFGGTIAHGFLTLSMLSRLAENALPMLGDTRESLNYGFDKVRFLSPVPSGSRIRGVFTLAAIDEKPQGRVMLRLNASVEIEGADRPALIAEWLIMLVFDVA